MKVHVLNGVRFEWRLVDQPGDCMNVAKVLVEDACHTVLGELQICVAERSDETEFEWRLRIEDGHHVEPGRKGGRFGVDLKEFVRAAIEMSASEMNDELRERQARTREMLAHQDSQRRYGKLINEALGEIEF